MVRHLFVVFSASAAVLLGGCASAVSMDPPTPDGPRLTRLEARPAGGVAGCPLTLVFAFDAGHDEIVKAVAGWSRSLGRRASAGRAVLDVPADAFRGHPRGEAAARVVPARPGRYEYYVQVEDRAGRKSNVLETVVSVDGWWASGC
jgi:hypothetical protein